MKRKFKVGNTTYQRSPKYGVGKEIGGKIYVHKDYADRVISEKDYNLALSMLPENFRFNCVMVDRKRPHVIRFDEAPDFDTAREPMVGDFIEVNYYDLELRSHHSDNVWHHKWMWVDDDYTGFDVEESYQWSKRWTQFISHPSGSSRVWETQVKNFIKCA